MFQHIIAFPTILNPRLKSKIWTISRMVMKTLSFLDTSYKNDNDNNDVHCWQWLLQNETMTHKILKRESMFQLKLNNYRIGGSLTPLVSLINDALVFCPSSSSCMLCNPLLWPQVFLLHLVLWHAHLPPSSLFNFIPRLPGN